MLPTLSWETDRSRCQPALAGSCAVQMLGNGQGGPIGRKGPAKVALSAQGVADFVVRNRQVALPVGVDWILGRKAFAYGQGGPIGGKRPAKVALSADDVTDSVVRH